MEINQTKAENYLLNLIQKRELIFDKSWGDHKFGKLKLASTTEKGDIGEDFLRRILAHCGYRDIEIPQGRRGNYDIGVREGPNKMLLEVKLATQDTNGNFQFNGVRHDTEYTHLFCLGILPDSMGYFLTTKHELNNETLVTMAKNTNATFKLTKKQEDLRSFDFFCDDIAKYMNE